MNFDWNWGADIFSTMVGLGALIYCTVSWWKYYRSKGDGKVG